MSATFVNTTTPTRTGDNTVQLLVSVCDPLKLSAPFDVLYGEILGPVVAVRSTTKGRIACVGCAGTLCGATLCKADMEIRSVLCHVRVWDLVTQGVTKRKAFWFFLHAIHREEARNRIWGGSQRERERKKERERERERKGDRE